MKLVGQYDSPYTRRVAVSLTLLGLQFEQLPLSLFADFAKMQAINPLVRIPSLILEDGEILIDSGAILDWIDESVGADKALIPTHGVPRRQALKILAIATGAIDKAMAINYERTQRPADKIHMPWVERLTAQLKNALKALDDLPLNPWFIGDKISQPDITTTAMIGYIKLYAPDLFGQNIYPNLEKLTRQCEALPAFKTCRPTPENLGGDIDMAKAAIKRLQA